MKRLTTAILHMAAMWDFQPIFRVGLEAAGTDEICLQGQDSGHTPGNSACGLRSSEYACFGLVWHWSDILRGRRLFPCWNQVAVGEDEYISRQEVRSTNSWTDLRE